MDGANAALHRVFHVMARWIAGPRAHAMRHADRPLQVVRAPPARRLHGSLHMMRISLALLALAACTPETTSFRTTDRGDGVDRGGPSSAAYTLRGASVHVWSNGGYIGSSDEPMTHVAFEIRNTSTHAIVFDGDALAIGLADTHGAALPPARFVTVTPLGPAKVTIESGATTMLDAYFLLPVRPRQVEAMHVHWALVIDDLRAERTTGFVRDDS